MSVIFRDIAPYLLNKTLNKSFKDILELCLLNKNSLKLYQNILSLYYVFDFELFKNYIYYSKNNNYNLKIIQYKDFESIKINNFYSSDMDCDYEFLNEHCPKLKTVYYMDYLVPSPVHVYSLYDEFNPCFNGYFVFNKSEIRIDHDLHLPISNINEYNQTIQLTIDQLYNYEFTFEYMDHYKSKKVIIKNSSYKGVSNIALCKYIESISFAFGHESTYQFLKVALQQPHIKSLSLNLNLNKDINLDNILDGLNNSNSNIRRLCLYNNNDNNEPVSNEIIISQLESLYNHINKHRFITIIALDLFKVQDSIMYDPLLCMKNINTIHIRLTDEYNSPLFNHLLINQNIIKVVIHFDHSKKKQIYTILNLLMANQDIKIKNIILKIYYIQNLSLQIQQQDINEFNHLIKQYTNNNCNIKFKQNKTNK